MINGTVKPSTGSLQHSRRLLLLCRLDASEGKAIGQEQPSDAEPAPQPRFAAQSQSQPEQSIASKSQEATGSAADSTAEVAATFSSGGGGRDMSVPPSSPQGPPAGVGVTPSSAAAVKTEAAGQPAPRGASSAEALADAADDAPFSTSYSPRNDQPYYDRPSDRLPTHAGFMPGMHFV